MLIPIKMIVITKSTFGKRRMAKTVITIKESSSNVLSSISIHEERGWLDAYSPPLWPCGYDRGEFCYIRESRVKKKSIYG